MAVQINNGATNQYLVRANNATPISTGATTPWSMALWFYRDTDRGTNEHIAMMTNDTVGVASSGQGIRVSSADILQVTAGGGQTTLLNPLPVGAWYYAAMTFGNSTGTAYYGTLASMENPLGSRLTTGTGRSNVSGILDTVILGRSPAAAGGGQSFSGRLAHVRFWTGALAKNDFEAEMPELEAVISSGLWAAYEFTSSLNTASMLADTSGNARNLSSDSVFASSNYVDGPLTESAPAEVEPIVMTWRM
jgi:hypothetical protein